MTDGVSASDLTKLINDILKKTDSINKTQQCSIDQEDSKSSYCDRSVARPSAAAIPCAMTPDCGAYEGDPRNSYRELRRYLLDIGIDSRIFSFGTIPMPAAMNVNRKYQPTLATDVGSLDNCFFFEMRKVIESGLYGEKVNALVIMFRVFFEGSQDSPVFWVQSVLNHYHDANLELNQIYKKTIPALIKGCWSHPTAGKESTRVTYLEKRFTDVTDFKHEFNAFHRQFRADGMRGNNLEPHS